MYNNIKTLVFVLLIFSGCSKKLNLSPKDSISDETFWKTAADYEKAANDLYFSLQGFNTSDAETGIAFFVPNPISNGTYQAPETDNNWNSAYHYIRNCNKIIEEASKSKIATDLKQYVAEAKFFRAYNYWLLFRLYGGVPLITKVLGINDEELFSTRATREETVNLILKDLTEAALDLPEQKELSSSAIGRITKGAAISLKARVALFEGTWEKFRSGANTNELLDVAIKSSESVMNSSQYSLWTGKGNQSYRYLFIEEGDDASEDILDRRYQQGISNQSFSYDVGATGMLLPTKKLADIYLCTDGLPITETTLFRGYNTTTSEFKNRDPRMTMTFLIPGALSPQPWYVEPTACWPFYPQRNPNTGYTTYKFISENAYGNELPGDHSYSFDHHIIRYAEVLLIYAEATFERNGNISDADLDKSINLLRQRVNMPILTNAFVATNGLDMRQEIRRERTVELALEGFRYDDLRRWKTAEIEMPQAIRGIKIVGTNWTDPVVIEGANRNPYAGEFWQSHTDSNGFIVAEDAASRSFDPNKDYLRPIPTKEVSLNPKLKQNPGW
jgi:hypothetical protein